MLTAIAVLVILAEKSNILVDFQLALATELANLQVRFLTSSFTAPTEQAPLAPGLGQRRGAAAGERTARDTEGVRRQRAGSAGVACCAHATRLFDWWVCHVQLRHQ